MENYAVILKNHKSVSFVSSTVGILRTTLVFCIGLVFDGKDNSERILPPTETVSVDMGLLD